MIVGTLELVAASPAAGFEEPLTLPEVKAYLSLPQRQFPDDEEDAMLNGFIAGAREQGEILQGCDLVMKRWALHLDYFYACEIRLREKLHSVQAVTYTESDGAANVFSDYVVDTKKRPGIIRPAYGKSWPTFTPWPTSAVRVDFTAGTAPDDVYWQDAGQRVKIGMKLLISHWFNGRLPFELGAHTTAEYPYTVTACLSYGAIPRAR